jgi:YgiT-type zinc finger domain-containing protein
MRCLICAQAEIVADTRELPYTYKGESTTIPGVTEEYCPACGEAILDASESARASASMLEFNRQVNASIVDPEFISGGAGGWHWISARLRRFSAVRSTRFRGTGTAKQNRRWLW